jgi:competence protein ComFC
MITISPKRISGEWLYGYALDFHTLKSDYMGGGSHGSSNFDNTRSEMGDLVYRLKYKSNRSLVTEIAESACAFVKEQHWQPDLLVSVPPSCVTRSFQPVFEVAAVLSSMLQIDCYNGCIEKISETPELKNIDKYKERVKLLRNAYEIADKSLVEGKNILLFDDLYRSGATLGSIARVLNQDGNVKRIFALTLTRTRSKK